MILRVDLDTVIFEAVFAEAFAIQNGTAKKTIKLIKLVRDEPGIWDIQSEVYQKLLKLF